MKTADTRPIACFTGAGRQSIQPESFMSAKKPFRPKARRPRGFEDRSGPVLRAERHLVETASRIYDDWGFEPLQTPAFEFADALGKFL
ncbi:MAG: histidyl-tRNA synthetase, partial [Maricaulis sp.]